MNRIARRTWGVAAAVACATTLAVSSASPVQAAEPTPTKVRIINDDGNVRVKVTSNRAACERGRLVIMYEVADGEPAPGIGGRTNRRGVIRLGDFAGDLRLGAIAPATRECGYAQARVVHIDEPLPE